MEKDHAKILRFLAERSGPEACYPFAPICKATGLPRQRVRFICRLFRRKGWTEFHSALCNDYGEFRGSGYCISPAGIAAFQSFNPT